MLTIRIHNTSRVEDKFELPDGADVQQAADEWLLREYPKMAANNTFTIGDALAPIAAGKFTFRYTVEQHA